VSATEPPEGGPPPGWGEVDPAGGAAAAGAPPVRGADRRRRRRSRRRLVLVVLGLLVLALGGVVTWYELEAHPLGGPGKGVIISITQDEAEGTVLSDLASHGVIGSSLAFRLSFIVHGTPPIEPGTYYFHENQTFGAVRSVLSGGTDVFPIDVEPGYTAAEVAERVADIPGQSGAAFEAALRSGAVRSPFQASGSKDLEGLLGVGTYEVVPGETATQLLAAMVGRFDKEAGAAGIAAAAPGFGLSPYELVTVASIVEKEGYIEKNMGMVARVIYNRLARGTPLQMDSTVLYSLGQDGGPVTPADEKLDTPYNTYLHTGLPPTPIATPSPTALRSAAHPPAGAWLYFELVNKDGTEQFSDTFAEQLAAEQLAQSRGL
jgi:UPF0755 protein